MPPAKPVRSPWRDRTDWPDAPCVVRMRMPDDGEITIEDAVQGTVTVRNAQLDDMVILRGDGTPTYMLAVVVDDHDMGVTHVIRGDDHLNNAFRQSMVYRGMGWNVPVFAHIPLIHGADGAKLSKRHGALGVDAIARWAFCPRRWSTTCFVLAGATATRRSSAAMTLFRCSISAASANRRHASISTSWPTSTATICARWMTPASGTLWRRIYTRQARPPPERVTALAPLLKERAKTHLDIAGSIGYLVHDGAPEIEDDAAGLLDDYAVQIFTDLPW